jgi:NAD(P)-dependent dehydrogenase (short-subunit alcohol dehydrogenase family)
MNILITGASRGIGRDLAIHLAQQPANQILVLSRNEARLKELSDQYRNIRHLKYDLGRPDPEALKDQLDGWEKLDILVNGMPGGRIERGKCGGQCLGAWALFKQKCWRRPFLASSRRCIPSRWRVLLLILR